MKERDQAYMHQAVRLARRAPARPSYRPRTGVVIATPEGVVGRVAASADGATPAIISALDQAGPMARGATLYTTLDPCADAPDEAACLSRLVESGLARVVTGQVDEPYSPALERLKQSGVEVVTGVCAEQCRELNEIYLKYSRAGRPFVTVKFASSLDGRIATATGDSQWISSPSSLRLAHSLRREHDAIMVGIGTVLKDDPRLTVRLVNGCDPLRVIVDSHLRIPLAARVLREGAAHRTLIATTGAASPERASELKDLGAEVLVINNRRGGPYVDLAELFQKMGDRHIASVLVEGGAGIITSLISDRLVDRLVVAVAPKIIGRGIEAVGDLSITRLSDAIAFTSVKTRKLGPDVIFDGRLAANTYD